MVGTVSSCASSSPSRRTAAPKRRPNSGTTALSCTGYRPPPTPTATTSVITGSTRTTTKVGRPSAPPLQQLISLPSGKGAPANPDLAVMAPRWRRIVVVRPRSVAAAVNTQIVPSGHSPTSTFISPTSEATAPLYGSAGIYVGPKSRPRLEPPHSARYLAPEPRTRTSPPRRVVRWGQFRPSR